ncbi:MAG: DUF7305 domain-containing protein [Polyangiaceae bacterium]
MSLKLATGFCVLTGAVACGSSDKNGLHGLGSGTGDAGAGVSDAAPTGTEAGPAPSLHFGGKDSGADVSQAPAGDASDDATAPVTTSADGSAADAPGSPSDDASQTADAADDGSLLSSSDASGSTDGDNGLDVDSRAAYCVGSGPPVTVGDSVSGTTTCTGALADLTFTHAICSCTDVNVQGVLQTDSWSSNLATYMAGQYGGAVGLNRNFVVAGVPDIGGTLAIGGSNGLTLAGAGIVEGDLDVAGNVSLAGVSTVGRDLWAEGNVTSLGVLGVGRDLHQTTGGAVIGIVPVGGTSSQSSFTLPEPCACQPSEILDIGAIVAQGKALNDNASIGLSASAYDLAVGVSDVTLPCGRFYLDQIGGVGDVTFHVPGRTALFVDGDVISAGVLSFDVGAQGELDVFIRGNLVPTGLTTFGSITRPAATRVYVGGSQNVVITGAGMLAGNLYAPNATVIITGFSDFFGSIFAGNFEAPGALFVHYDRGVLDAAQDCPPPSTGSGDDGGSSDASTADASPPADSGSSPALDSGATPPADAGSTQPEASTSTPDASSTKPDAAPPPPPPPPPPSCKTCGSCSGATACVSGGCGACHVDSDCCSPLVCVIANGTGSCQPLLQ